MMDAFAESLEVDDLPFTEEFDHIVDIRIITEPKDVVIGNACFLFRRQIFNKIRHGIALDLKRCCCEWETGSGSWVYADGMIYKVLFKRSTLDILFLQVSCQLVNDGTDHLQVSQFLCTCIGFKAVPCEHRMDRKGERV